MGYIVTIGSDCVCVFIKGSSTMEVVDSDDNDDDVQVMESTSVSQ